MSRHNPECANTDLRQKLTQAEPVIVELHGVFTELRKQIESQQAPKPVGVIATRGNRC